MATEELSQIFVGTNSSNLFNEHNPIYHVLSGSFRSLSLYLLAFYPSTRSLEHIQTVPGFGPHQYLAADAQKNYVYTTSWALPPILSSWEIEKRDPWRVNHVNNVPITATSSYTNVPPPFTHVYSAGGPTGEVHLIDSVTKGFGDQIQRVLFVPEEELENADKTRVALRYGSHGIEFSSSGYGFIPVLGTDTIEMYTRDHTTGLLTHLSSNPSPRGTDVHDGPRHVKVHPNGRVLYCVTEHTNLVDVYSITPPTLTYVASREILPQSLSSKSSVYRGDTLLLTPPSPLYPAPSALFTTTRGKTTSEKGWISILALDSDGYFTEGEERYETPTSGGKANAIDLLPKSLNDENSQGMWILLTDDDDNCLIGPGIRVLEWDGWGKGGVKIVAEWPVAGSEGGTTSKNDLDEERMQGGSHAIWLD